MRRALILLLIVGLAGLGDRTANASDAARDALKRVADANGTLRRLFSRATISEPSDLRAEAAAIENDVRHALVVYRSSQGGSELGARYCTAALSRDVRNDALSSHRYGDLEDPLVAARLSQTASPGVRFRHLIEGEEAGVEGWQAYRCSVRSSDIDVDPVQPPSESAIAEATYDVAKALIKAGRQSEAVERLRRLRYFPHYYVNAVLFLVSILEETRPDITSGLRDKAVDLDAATDSDALQAFSRASRKIGLDAQADAALRRCRQLGGCLSGVE
jgi:hypothetical protein